MARVSGTIPPLRKGERETALFFSGYGIVSVIIVLKGPPAKSNHHVNKIVPSYCVVRDRYAFAYLRLMATGTWYYVVGYSDFL